MNLIVAQPLTREAFAPFGDVIDTEEAASFLINKGKCERFHDLAKVEVTGDNARVLVSIVRSGPYPTPAKLEMVERHPFGSQAFVPLCPMPFLVVVCPDENGRPGKPHAFITKGGQGVNYFRNTWHGVLTPIVKEQDFLVVDRGGDGTNLEEFYFDTPYEVQIP